MDFRKNWRWIGRSLKLIALAGTLSGAALGCLSPPDGLNQGTTSASPSPSVTATSTSTPTPSATASATPTPTVTVTVTGTPAPIVVAAPSISYAGNNLFGIVGTPLVGTLPTNSGGPASACSSTPALPAGLTLSSTCLITGTPSAITASAAYTITASNTGGTSSTSLTIAVTGPAAKLVFITTPASLLVGKALGSITLAVQDAQGNTVTPASCLVSLRLTDPNGPGTLTSGSGALWDLCSNGTVTFSNVYLHDWTGPGRPINLTATATGLSSAVSPDINVLAVEQKAYLKAPNPGSPAYYGGAVALSSDGNTLAVGSPGEKSNQTTITNGTGASSNTALSYAGAVYIVTRNGSTWIEQAYLKPPNPLSTGNYGIAVALSSDGNTVAVGAYGEKSNQTTITNGATASANTSLTNAGAVYVVTRSGSTWTEQAYLKAPNAGSNNVYYGYTVALSADGNTLAIGAYGEKSNQTTITNGPTASSDTSLSGAGAVYIVTRTGATWTEQAYLKPPNPVGNAGYGGAVALSSDGNTLAVGAYGESSNQTTITNGPTASSDTSLTASGAVYIATRTDATWTEQAYLKPPNPVTNASYGAAVALSSDGNTLAVGAYADLSSQTTITNGPTASSDTSLAASGAVYIATRTGATWTEQAYLKAPKAANSFYGYSVALSSSGNVLAIGASSDNSNQTTLTNGPSASLDTSLSNSGAAYIATRSGSTWTQRAYLKPPNPVINGNYGGSVALSSDGSTLAVGASGEKSNQTTITNGPGASNDTSINGAGAVYVLSIPWSTSTGF